MKILYVTTISLTMNFFIEHFKMLLQDGNQVELACNCEKPVSEKITQLGVIVNNIAFSRSPFSKSNVLAKKQLKKLINYGDYDVIHCHTPIAAAITRVVCKKYRKNGLKVIYTAHGFHFYKGAPLLNWLIYYPIEKLCSRWTDVLITINKEDYNFALKKMKAKKVCYIPGVGIDTSKIDNLDICKFEKRQELGLKDDTTVFLSVGELNDNKNHSIVIKAFGELKKEGKISNFKYLICGQGINKESLELLIQQYNLDNEVQLLGYRKDICEICKSVDCFVFPSFREGLSVSLMEAMACNLPVICSKIRGNVDLIDVNGGFLFNPKELLNIKSCIIEFINLSKQKKVELGLYNKNKLKEFELENVLLKLKDIYTNL